MKKLITIHVENNLQIILGESWCITMARRALRNNNRCDKQVSNQVNDKFGGSPPTFEQRVLYKKINFTTSQLPFIPLCRERLLRAVHFKVETSLTGI